MRHPVSGLPLTSPRAFALAIASESSVARQRQFFEACPFEWRAQVREHVKTAQARIEQVRAHKHLVVEATRKDPLPAAPDNNFRISDYKKSAPEVGNRELSKLKALVGVANGH